MSNQLLFLDYLGLIKLNKVEENETSNEHPETNPLPHPSAGEITSVDTDESNNKYPKVTPHPSAGEMTGV